jgi:hypothetical protein
MRESHQMLDPMALITDFALGIFALVFAARIRRVHRLWALAFLFTALGAFSGGIYHAFAPTDRLLWKATTIAVGIASFYLLEGADRRLVIFAVVKLVVYIGWMITHEAFVWVIVDYGISLLLIAIVCIARRDPATRWILGTIATSIAGGIVQYGGWSIDPTWFDFNDLYHVIQTAALWMLYRAALVMKPSS